MTINEQESSAAAAVAAAADDRVDALVRDLPPVVAPPARFADRVMRARAFRSRAQWIAAATAVSLVAFIAYVGHSPPIIKGDSAPVDARATVDIGEHVIAVVEPQAKIAFDVVRALFGPDRVSVAQSAGRAFYRVDPGTEVAVDTPAGRVIVHGTCFTVEVERPNAQKEDPNMIAVSPKLKSLSHVAAVAAGALLTVVVYEGVVNVQNDHGEVVLRAGDRATANAGAAPIVAAAARARSPFGIERLERENAGLRGALDAARAASGGDVNKLLKENQELRERLKSADDELALVDADRKDKEGEPLEPPKDLAPRFQEKALLKAFADAFAQTGIKGDVSHIDCAEYPCIVYGDIASTADVDAMTLAEKLKNAPALAPYIDDEDNNSWWRSLEKNAKTGAVVDQTSFGIAKWPNTDTRGDDIGKRVGFRNQQMWNAMKPQKP